MSIQESDFLIEFPEEIANATINQDARCNALDSIEIDSVHEDNSLSPCLTPMSFQNDQGLMMDQLDQNLVSVISSKCPWSY